MAGVIRRDHLVNDPLDRLSTSELRVDALERIIEGAGTVGPAGPTGATGPKGDPGGPLNQFIQMTDTPAAYAGQVGKFLRVNAVPDAIEFVTDLEMIDDSFVGILAGGRIIFDLTPAPDLLTLASCDVDISGGYLDVRRDEDITSYFGRAAVGFCGHVDMATFAHLDCNNANDYALLQAATGATILNAKTATTVEFRINNAQEGYYNATGFYWTGGIAQFDNDVGIGTAPAKRLDVADNVADYVVQFHNAGNNVNRYGLAIVAGGTGAAVGTTEYLAAFDGVGAWTGEIKTVNGVFQLADISDSRRKANIKDTEIVGLDIVNQLRVRDYNWKDNPDGPVMTSFVAQEAMKVYPDMVGETEDGTLMTSRAMLIPVLAKAIQEQQVQNQALLKRIDQLEKLH